MKFKGAITISRPQGNNCDYISISLVDEDSRIQFVDVEIKYSDFAQLITGLSYVPCEVECRGLENIGKKKVVKSFEFMISDNNDWSNQKEKAIELADKVCPEGWKISKYFGSQDSFFTKDGQRWARTHIMKWVGKGASDESEGNTYHDKGL